MLTQPLRKKPGRDRKILVMRARQAAAIFARFGFRRRMVGDGVLRRQRTPWIGERRSRGMAGSSHRKFLIAEDTVIMESRASPPGRTGETPVPSTKKTHHQAQR